MKKTLAFWLTGLSGSGKTTIVNEAVRLLSGGDKRVKVYDGDVVREKINTSLTFSPEHIRENNRIIAELCRKDVESQQYDYIFVPVISPFRDARQRAKEMIGSSCYVVYCKSSLEAVIKRDPKGLYKKALAGHICNFIGVDEKTPYEEPLNADLVLDTQNDDLNTCVSRLIQFIHLKEK
ncbi:MAG: adenylyl-sulfate kinase [Candidatus Omnitrophica bacterium]|nr:adenylyl-sulfate kinase [Candidatus Omnitrophota bacterium]MDD5774977.1 adenylyl-sulfate kinase [Candidatus Omnitrophota bacterium]